jgi:hypothetical protein
MGYGAVQFGRNLPTFQRNILPLSSRSKSESSNKEPVSRKEFE